MAEHFITEAVVGAAIEVHRHLGPGLLESVFEEALCHEMGLRDIEFQRQTPVDVKYKGVVIKGQRLDLLVAGQVVVELKAQAKVPVAVVAQILSYLKPAGLKTALLINFGAPRLADGIKRISL